METNIQATNPIIFKDYPDVLDVKQISNLLGVSTKMVYKLIKDGTLLALKIGREFRVPKVTLIKLLKIQ